MACCNCKLVCACYLLLLAASSAGGAAVNISVYWGQDGNEGSLATACNTGRYAFVIIAFLCVFGGGQTPVLNLAGHCDPAMGWCTAQAADIQHCQRQGVKVLLSIGGSEGNYTLYASDAQSVATYLWDNFLGGNSSGSGNSSSRPLGNAVLDGIDFDIELGQASHYVDLAKNLTLLYKGDRRGKKYLLTAATWCLYPDFYLGAALATGLFDHVWIRFYNNRGCDYQNGDDMSSLEASWKKWTQSLPSSASVFLGLPASPDAVSTGYIDPTALVSHVLPVVEVSPNYGGIMLWNDHYDNTSYSAKLLTNAVATDPPIGSPISGGSGIASLPKNPPVTPNIGSSPNSNSPVTPNIGSSPNSNSPVTPNIGPSHNNRIGRIYTIVGASGLSGFFIIVLIIFMCYKRCYGMILRQRGPRNPPRIESFLRCQGSLHPKGYTYSEVKRMTKSFSHKLGQGGYGTVYRGNMRNGREVAIKMLKGIEGDGEEFMNEVASISRTSHINIVTLVGYCLEGSKRALLYEYMPNGSLERYTFGNNSIEGEDSFSWVRLFNIVKGIARGLEYLHAGCNTRIVHFDIKPHNILLDHDFCPKISDFGLAKLCRQKESRISIAGARGTVGYIAPEVFSRNYGPVGSKADVYSYGMVVLEMVGARKKIDVSTNDSSSKYFPQWLYENFDQFCGLTTSESSNNDTTEVLLRKMIIVGLWCIQSKPDDRPSMGGVLEMLESSVVDLQLPTKAF